MVGFRFAIDLHSCKKNDYQIPKFEKNKIELSPVFACYMIKQNLKFADCSSFTERNLVAE